MSEHEKDREDAKESEGEPKPEDKVVPPPVDASTPSQDAGESVVPAGDQKGEPSPQAGGLSTAGDTSPEPPTAPSPAPGVTPAEADAAARGEAPPPTEGESAAAEPIVETTTPPRAELPAEATAAAPDEPLDHLGVLVEFETPAALMAAAAKVRDAGFKNWDCHTPFPVHGLDQAMGVRPTVLPWLSFLGGITGGSVGLILQCYTNGVLLPFSLLQNENPLVSTFLSPFLPSGYPFVVSGKPIFSIPAFIPVTFELTILLAAFGAFFGMLALNKLPTFWHPVFTNPRFRRASSDRFFISIEGHDPLYDRDRVRALCETLGASHVEELEG